MYEVSPPSLKMLAPGVFHDCLLSTNLEDTQSFSDRMVESQNEMEINRSKQGGNGSSAPSPTPNIRNWLPFVGRNNNWDSWLEVGDQSGLTLIL